MSDKIDEALDALLSELPEATQSSNPEQAVAEATQSADPEIVPQSVDQPLVAPSIPAPPSPYGNSDAEWNATVNSPIHQTGSRVKLKPSGPRQDKSKPKILIFLILVLLGSLGYYAYLMLNPPADSEESELTENSTSEETLEDPPPAQEYPVDYDSSIDPTPVKPPESVQKTKVSPQTSPTVSKSSPSLRVIAQPQRASQDPRILDSAKIMAISGPIHQGLRSLKFTCDLYLFSSTKGLNGRIPPFEEAIRVVVSNIFYFSGSENPQIPELEREILQKTGFLFPQGKIVRVELRDLRLELVSR